MLSARSVGNSGTSTAGLHKLEDAAAAVQWWCHVDTTHDGLLGLFCSLMELPSESETAVYASNMCKILMTQC
jgi:hypothetical protein